MLVGAAMIVRDEAAVLDRCLTSLVGLVDEIVIVDTGSIDESVAIAERHGARVVHEPWRDDFALARNRSLELVEADWVLYIDADEAVRAGDHAAVRRALADETDRLVGLVPFVPRVGWTPYREYRLWRNRPELRFVGAMHESIVPAATAVAAAEGLRVGPFDLLTIDHYGYEGDQRAKHRRDEPLLLAGIERSPERSYYYDHLARVYESIGDDERAVASWRRGIEMTRRRGLDQPDDVLLWVDLCDHLLARRQLTDELAGLIEEASIRFAGLPTVELASARHEFATGRPGAAAERVERLVSMTPAEILDSGGSYDARVFGEWAYDLLGLCRFALGDFAAAAEAFADAERHAPGDARYSGRRAFARARAASTARA